MKKILNAIRLFKRTAKGSYNINRYPEKLQYPEILNQIKLDESDIIFNVTHIDDFVTANGCLFGVITANNFIVVDDIYMNELSDIAKSFIIYHEMGHAIHGDTKNIVTKKDGRLNSKRRIKDIKNNKVDTKELYADLFAAEKIGVHTAISALKELITISNSKNFIDTSITIKELNLRIDNLLDIIK